MRRDLPWLKDSLSKRLCPNVDIRHIDAQDVPKGPGVYIMQAEDKVYPYPWRGSRVFYIGESSNLRRRLCASHRKFILQIMEGRPEHHYYWPLYEYAAYHGCRVCWLSCADSKHAKELEYDMLVAFAYHYGARPIANTHGAWG